MGVKELRDVARAPLTLTLTPKRRGEITFDNSGAIRRRGKMKSARSKVNRAEESEKMVNEAAEEAFDLLNSDKRRA